ncbi:MAG: hypothetical protein HOE90_14455 [Bacteriovoracaceae bacterium]|jgi:hypothetical protein|nr:hypothetical protein [Bacteriovoracaceae bacterium]
MKSGAFIIRKSALITLIQFLIVSCFSNLQIVWAQDYCPQDDSPPNLSEILTHIKSQLKYHDYDIDEGKGYVEGSGVRLILQDGLPNNGMFDGIRGEKSYSIRSQSGPKKDKMIAAYTIRTAAILDLLKSRLSLKQLIGGESGLTRLNTRYGGRVSNYQDFSVPTDVKILYSYGRVNQYEPLGSIIEDLDSRDYGSSYALKRKVFDGLILYSFELTKLDQRIRFLNDEMWLHPKFISMAESDRAQDLYCSQKEGYCTPRNNLKHHIAKLKKKYITRYKIGPQIEELLATREYILNRYRILSNDFESIPLYQHIYSYFVKNYEFPSTKEVQSVPDNSWPSYSTEIIHPLEYSSNQSYSESLPMEMPMAFDSNLMTSMDSVKNSYFMNAYDTFAGTLEKILYTALRANGESLEYYSTTENYDGFGDSYFSSDMPFHELAIFPGYVAAAKELFAEHAAAIDNGAYLLASKLSQKQRSRAKLVQGLMIGGSIVAVGAVLLTGGLALAGAAPILVTIAGTSINVATAAFFVGGSVAFAGSVLSYVDKRRVAKLASNLFFGTVDGSQHEYSEESVEIESDALRDMIIMGILTFIPANKLMLLTRGLKVVGTKVIIPIAKSRAIIALMQTSKLSLRALGSLGKFLSFRAGQTFLKLRSVGATVAQKAVLTKELQMRAAMFAKGLSRPTLYSRMLASVGGAKGIPGMSRALKYFLGLHHKALAIEPSFYVLAGTDIAIDMGVMLSVDYMVRDNFDEMLKDWNFVGTNLIGAIVIVGSLHLFTTLSRFKQLRGVLEAAGISTARMNPTQVVTNAKKLQLTEALTAKGLMKAGETLSMEAMQALAVKNGVVLGGKVSFLGQFGKSLLPLFLIGAIAGGIPAAALEYYDYKSATNNETGAEKIKRVALTSVMLGAYIAISSNARTIGVNRLLKNNVKTGEYGPLVRLLRSKSASSGIKSADDFLITSTDFNIRMANNLFGSGLHVILFRADLPYIGALQKTEFEPEGADDLEVLVNLPYELFVVKYGAPSEYMFDYI